MAEEKTKQEEKKEIKQEEKKKVVEAPKEDKKETGETKIEEKKETEKKAEETKKEEKDKKKKKEEKPSKTEVIVNGKDLGISTKHSIAVCRFIRGKSIEKASSQLQEVVNMKRAIPMKGEIPHRKGMERGRYPVNACKVFIKLLKQLAGNAIVGNMDIDKGKIECKANRASRPYKRGGSEKFKRTHVFLKLKINKK